MEELKNTNENLENNNSNSKKKRKTPYKRNYNKKQITSKLVIYLSFKIFPFYILQPLLFIF